MVAAGGVIDALPLAPGAQARLDRPRARPRRWRSSPPTATAGNGERAGRARATRSPRPTCGSGSRRRTGSSRAVTRGATSASRSSTRPTSCDRGRSGERPSSTTCCPRCGAGGGDERPLLRGVRRTPDPGRRRRRRVTAASSTPASPPASATAGACTGATRTPCTSPRVRRRDRGGRVRRRVVGRRRRGRVVGRRRRPRRRARWRRSTMRSADGTTPMRDAIAAAQDGGARRAVDAHASPRRAVVHASWAPPGTAARSPSAGSATAAPTGSTSRWSSQLTVDDSWVQEQVASGQLSEAEADRHPRAHAITRWVGADAPGGRSPGDDLRAARRDGSSSAPTVCGTTRRPNDLAWAPRAAQPADGPADRGRPGADRDRARRAAGATTSPSSSSTSFRRPSPPPTGGSDVTEFAAETYQNEFLAVGRHGGRRGRHASPRSGADAVRRRTRRAAEIVIVDVSGSMDLPAHARSTRREAATGAAIDCIRDGVLFAVIAGSRRRAPACTRARARGRRRPTTRARGQGRGAQLTAERRHRDRRAGSAAANELFGDEPPGHPPRDPAHRRRRTRTRPRRSSTRRSTRARDASSATAAASARTGRSTSCAASPRPCSARVDIDPRARATCAADFTAIDASAAMGKAHERRRAAAVDAARRRGRAS